MSPVNPLRSPGSDFMFHLTESGSPCLGRNSGFYTLKPNPKTLTASSYNVHASALPGCAGHLSLSPSYLRSMYLGFQVPTPRNPVKFMHIHTKRGHYYDTLNPKPYIGLQSYRYSLPHSPYTGLLTMTRNLNSITVIWE